MQLAFSNSSTQTPSEQHTLRALSTSSSDHGFQAHHASGSGSGSGSDSQLVPSPGLATPSIVSDVTSGSASDSWADGIDFERFNERLHRLNLAERYPGSQSPGQRVADHENASAATGRAPRRMLEFRVIPHVGDAPSDGPCITDFPNGKRGANQHRLRYVPSSPLPWLIDYACSALQRS